MRRDGELVRLTGREREILRLLAARPGEPVSREELTPPGSGESTRAVDVQINRLRRSLQSRSAADDPGRRLRARRGRRQEAGMSAPGRDAAPGAAGAVGGDGHQPQRRTLWWRFNRFLERHLPEDLYRRSMIIVIAPMLLLQTIMAGVFLERHWERVTKTLSKSLGREIGFIVALYDTGPKTAAALKRLEDMANDRLEISMKVEKGTLPPPMPKPRFSILHYRLSKYVNRYAPGKPFWLDTSGEDGRVDIRVQVDEGLIFRFTPPCRISSRGAPPRSGPLPWPF